MNKMEKVTFGEYGQLLIDEMFLKNPEYQELAEYNKAVSLCAFLTCDAKDVAKEALDNILRNKTKEIVKVWKEKRHDWQDSLCKGCKEDNLVPTQTRGWQVEVSCINCGNLVAIIEPFLAARLEKEGK